MIGKANVNIFVNYLMAVCVSECAYLTCRGGPSVATGSKLFILPSRSLSFTRGGSILEQR